MKKFWCVQQKYFDRGQVKILVFAVNADVKPENGSCENKMCDEYRDYFDTYEEAAAWAKQAREA